MAKFLSEPTFHQKLRYEILFTLLPRTLAPKTPEERESQKATLEDVVKRLAFRSLLFDEGIKRLDTVIKFEKVTVQTWNFRLRIVPIDKFCNDGTLL